MSEDENIHDIVRRAADGDTDAWNELIRKYSSLLWWTARGFRLSDEQAADVVQVTWLRLVENIGRIRDPERLSAWLLTTARRRCIDELNAAARERPLDDHYFDLASDEDGPEECALRNEPRQAVRTALGRLPESQQRMLLLLVASPQLSYQEISTRLGIPIGSIGPSRGRALRRLHMELRIHHPGVLGGAARSGAGSRREAGDSRSPISA